MSHISLINLKLGIYTCSSTKVALLIILEVSVSTSLLAVSLLHLPHSPFRLRTSIDKYLNYTVIFRIGRNIYLPALTTPISRFLERCLEDSSQILKLVVTSIFRKNRASQSTPWWSHPLKREQLHYNRNWGFLWKYRNFHFMMEIKLLLWEMSTLPGTHRSSPQITILQTFDNLRDYLCKPANHANPRPFPLSPFSIKVQNSVSPLKTNCKPFIHATKMARLT